MMKGPKDTKLVLSCFKFYTFILTKIVQLDSFEKFILHVYNLSPKRAKIKMKDECWSPTLIIYILFCLTWALILISPGYGTNRLAKSLLSSTPATSILSRCCLSMISGVTWRLLLTHNSTCKYYEMNMSILRTCNGVCQTTVRYNITNPTFY